MFVLYLYVVFRIVLYCRIVIDIAAVIEIDDKLSLCANLDAVD